MALIESFQILFDDKDSAISEAKKALKLSKQFHFNQKAQIGENNYYFYMLSVALFKKIEEINQFHRFYKDILGKMIYFLKNEDFDNLNEDENFNFNYISSLIFDEKSIRTNNEYKKNYEIFKW